MFWQYVFHFTLTSLTALFIVYNRVSMLNLPGMTKDATSKGNYEERHVHLHAVGQPS